MKTESLLLIADARHVLERVARTTAAKNPLVASFAAWLCPDRFDTATATEAATKAAAAKGGERSSRGVAVQGFCCGLLSSKSAAVGSFVQHFDWLKGRPNFGTGGEPTGVLVDPISFLGVCVGARTVLKEERLREFNEWAKSVWKDSVEIAGEKGWHRDILDLIRNCVGGNQNEKRQADVTLPWLRAALARRGWATINEGDVASVLNSAVQGADTISDGFEAVLRLAAIDWATERALDFNLDAMTVADVARVLNNVTTIFQRWTWEEKPRTNRRGAIARQWHVDNEYHVQSLLYAVLKPIFPALDEEKYLASTGTYQPRADLCILALHLVIEVKFWYRGDKVKDLIEQIAADLSLYLRPDSPYRKVIAVIWDDAARTEEHGELRRGLTGLSGMHEVVILSRPSTMVNGLTTTNKRSSRSRKT